MLRHFGWDRVSILSTDTQFAKDLSTQLQSLWVGVHSDDSGEWLGDLAYSHTVILNDDGTVNEDSVRQGLAGMPTDDSRVVILNAHNQHAYPILQIAEELNFQPDTIWIGSSSWGDRFPRNGDLSWITDEFPGYLGITPYRNRNEDYVDYLSRLQASQRQQGRTPWTDLPDYAAEYMVDSIVSIARALSSLPPSLRRSGTDVTSQLRSLTFNGVSGEVSFTETGDRRDPRFTLFNMQRNKINGEVDWVSVGDIGIEVGSANLANGVAGICWASLGCGLDRAPSDKYPVPKEKVAVWIPVLISVIAVMLLAVTGMYFRTRRKKALLKLSMNDMRKKMEEMNNIDNQLLDINKQVEAAKRKQALLILKRAELQDKPETWTVSPDQLVAVLPEDDEYWTINDRLKETMNDAHISKVWRVQNTSLWTYYSFHRDRLSINNISHNERSVWHGTSTLDPVVIYNDPMDGFMMQFAAAGLWGRGIYFADKGEYSHSYAYHSPPAPAPAPATVSSSTSSWSWSKNNPIGSGASLGAGSGSERAGAVHGEREMFLAKLLVGDSVELSVDRSLTVPPINPKTGHKYTTVTGVTGGSKVWIVYGTF
jgi:hypothetical protein